MDIHDVQAEAAVQQSRQHTDFGADARARTAARGIGKAVGGIAITATDADKDRLRLRKAATSTPGVTANRIWRTRTRSPMRSGKDAR